MTPALWGARARWCRSPPWPLTPTPLSPCPPLPPGPRAGISGRKERRVSRPRSSRWCITPPSPILAPATTAVKLMDRVRTWKLFFQGWQMEGCVKLKGAASLGASRKSPTARSASKILKYWCKLPKSKSWRKILNAKCNRWLQKCKIVIFYIPMKKLTKYHHSHCSLS